MPNSGDNQGAIPRVLTIAGTDPTGGAGIQADIKSITAAGGFPYSVVTSLVAQNTRGVQEIFTPPIDFLRSQLQSVASDVAIDAVKIGMLGSVEIAEAVKEFIQDIPCLVVLDPVMVASSGDRLLQRDAEAAVLDLAHNADVVTPNLPELAVLAGCDVAATIDEALDQAAGLAKTLQAHVLMKGGHFTGDHADNALVSPDGAVHSVPVQRIATTNTHGTGCSLSSALATRLAAGHSPADAVEWASRWLHEAISNADALKIGTSNGPVDHSHTTRRMTRAASTWAPSASAPTQPRLHPAGPYTQKMWDDTAGYLTDILALPFIQQLGAGTLRHDDFIFYLQQDALYLGQYAKALRKLGGQWAIDADGAIAAEREMQDTWLANIPEEQQRMSQVTQGYTDFLLASVYGDAHAVGQAAVLPCYWLYHEVGLRLAEANHPDHPYHDWLATYASEEFESSTRSAIERVEQALAQNPEHLDAAIKACDIASHYEVDFFDQADRAWVVDK
ncbi:bifunctional hydroxymethylpyrimidine kinase/phosphomethylpyrimidine kinase [Corynebacterium breve]|uniref:bifunctional hydroxymethylpyrimidine kinase/phosphomethylpyrimidine kinase n=1 Tax=Corynebacterium breve TaxID=3049799 RepID=UPI003D7B86FD